METEVTPRNNGKIDASPDRVGMDTRRLGLLDSHFTGLIKAGKLQAASFLVAKDGQIVAHQAMGKLTNKADSTEVQPDSIRKVYSITKVVTAVAIMQLVEAGKLYLSQPVAHWIKEFDTDVHRRITLWHLLTHTSGLAGDPGIFFEPYTKPWYEWWAYEKKKAATQWESGDWVRLLLSGPLCDEPGKQWIYCSAAYGVLGEIIAKVSGMSYEEYLNKRIFEPLGMNRSFFEVPEALRQETCFTGPWEEGDIFKPENRAGMPPRGGNGLYSTLEDLWKFGQTILNGGMFVGHRLLGRRTVEMMVSNQLKNVPSRCWGNNTKSFPHGVGWNLGHDDICSPGTYNHEGAGGSGLYIDPKEKLVFVFFGPYTREWTPEAMINPRAIVWSSLL